MYLGLHLKVPHTLWEGPQVVLPGNVHKDPPTSYFLVDSRFNQVGTSLAMMLLCIKLGDASCQGLEGRVWETTLEICRNHQRHHQGQGSIFSSSLKIAISDSIFFLVLYRPIGMSFFSYFSLNSLCF